MRKAFSTQGRLDCEAIRNVPLNLNCRDEIIPILAALQHIYAKPDVRDAIMGLVAADVNANARDDRGREGMDYWQILVLASVRIGCNLDYDKLQDLAEQHRTLRKVMGIGDWNENTTFSQRRIQDNVSRLQPQTIERISHLIVQAGHELEPEAVKTSRADSFVVETNIHYPSESGLIFDGIRVILELCVVLAGRFDLSGWRQHEHVLRGIKSTCRNIARISSRKGPNYQTRLTKAYRRLLRRTKTVLLRAKRLCAEMESRSLNSIEIGQLERLKLFIARTEQVCNTAERRVLRGEKVPNAEKLFSLFEPHTQLYKRGKAGEPVQFGRLVLIYEDGAGFITHHYVVPRDLQDRDVVVEQTRSVQERLGGRIEDASFDRGFHSPEIQKSLAEIIPHPCVPKPGVKQSAAQQSAANVRFTEARRRHSGVESAIGALQSGNGLKRCRDRTEPGFERYVALAVLGRNLHTLGKLVIAIQKPNCAAAQSRRKAS